MKALKKAAIGAAALAGAFGMTAPAHTADVPKTQNPAPAATSTDTAPKVVKVAGAGTKGLDVNVYVGPGFNKMAINSTVKWIAEKCPTTLTEDASLGDKARIVVGSGALFERTFGRDDLTSVESMARRACDLEPSSS